MPIIEDEFERLRFLIKKSGKNMSEVAEFIGYSRSYLTDLISKKELEKTKINQILEFIKYNKSNSTIPPHKNLLPLLRDVHSVGSANTLNNSTPNGEVVEWIDAGDWFPGANAAIRHYEDSMLEYPSGCILALKEITDLKQGFILGKDYVIEYGDDWNRVTKRIQRRKDGTLMGYSTNADKYEDDTLIHQPLELHNIHRAWRVLGYVVKKESATGVVMVTGKN